MKPRTIKIIKRIVLGVLLTVALFFIILFTCLYFHFNITIFDRPSDLSDKRETIEVYHINWACDCPDFIEGSYYEKNPAYESREEDCIFIEPANSEVEIPESYYNEGHFKKRLRLTGSFYLKEGIPASYQKKTPGEKPDKAKVFRYDKIEYIRKDK